MSKLLSTVNRKYLEWNFGKHQINFRVLHYSEFGVGVTVLPIENLGYSVTFIVFRYRLVFGLYKPKYNKHDSPHRYERKKV